MGGTGDDKVKMKVIIIKSMPLHLIKKMTISFDSLTNGEWQTNYIPSCRSILGLCVLVMSIHELNFIVVSCRISTWLLKYIPSRMFSPVIY